jgi:ribosomal protein S12 methylthiotransferase
MLPLEVRQQRRARFMQVAEKISNQKLHKRIGSTMQVLVDSSKAMGKQGGVGRTYADAPEIDGVVHLLPPEKLSKSYRTGDFIKVRIIQTQGHDLIGLPI